MHPITQKIFDWIMKNRAGIISEGNIKVAYEVITGNYPTMNDISNIYDEIEQTYPPKRNNPYTKTEIRTKPQFVWYRAYSADKAPEITQLLFIDENKAIDHLKLLKFHGYGHLMIQKVYERYSEYAYDRPVRYTGWDNWRFVYGTKDDKWHLVGPADRDYATGFTTEQIRKLGPEGAKTLYLSPALIKHNPQASEQAMAEYRQHKEYLRKKLTEQKIELSGKNVSGELLHDLLVTGAPVFVRGRKYSVHQMSYGDYFLEPYGYKGGETEGFHPATLWMRKLPNINFYYLG